MTVWLWNPILNNRKLIKYVNFLKFAKIKVVTFDRKDASDYKLEYHPQVINSDILPEAKVDCEYGLFFVGYDKGRSEVLFKINRLQFKGKGNKILVVDNKEPTSVALELLIREGIPYNEYIVMLNDSDFIIDINQGEQVGLTVRVIEALYLNKRIITNNADVKKYDFYNEKRVFVISGDNFYEELEGFICQDEELQPLSDEILERYELNSLLGYVDR
ncbi:hypothetical protein [Shewanella sp. 30m-9]